MADGDLCDDAFLVWTAFLAALDADDTMLVIDQTFALIVEHWNTFSEDTQLLANKTIVNLTQEYDTQLRERIEYLPSLATIPMLSKTEGELVRLKSHVEAGRIFLNSPGPVFDDRVSVGALKQSGTGRQGAGPLIEFFSKPSVIFGS